MTASRHELDPASLAQFTTQQPGAGAVILGAYRQAVAAAEFDRATGLFAFATMKGARLLYTSLADASSRWTPARKRWVISIDSGITEPEALSFLLDQPRTEVRVPDAEQLLSRRLRPVRRFHPKTLLLEKRAEDFVPVAVIVGSANLTMSGFCLSHEHVMSYAVPAGGTTASLNQGALDCSAVFDAATRIDAPFIARYAAIRPASVSPAEDPENLDQVQLISQDRAEIPITMAAALAAVPHLWVDVEYVVANRGRRVEGNQIDLQRGTRVFFGFGDARLSPNSPIGSVRIEYKGHTAVRNLRFGHNKMDKLDLPIPVQEGPATYKRQTLLFTRKSDGVFQLQVGSPSDIANWKAKSSAQDTLFKMKGGREFGVFS
jgi:HKD family nuclease